MSHIVLNNTEFEEENLTTFEKVKINFKNRIPILTWLPNYQKDFIWADLISGITCGLLVVPMSIAFAGIAGLSPEYGLYSSYLGAFLYIFLGSCPQMSIGPVSILALMSYEICGPDQPRCVILAGFYSGVVELLFALLKLGWIINLISEPVVVGFTCGASLTIILSQVKNLLGINGKNGNGIITIVQNIIKDFHTIKLGDSVLGIVCLMIIIFITKIKQNYSQRGGHVFSLALTHLNNLRNILVLLITTLMAYLWTVNSADNKVPFKLTGNLTEGFPSITVPQFNLIMEETNSTTGQIIENHFTFWETITQIMRTWPIMIAIMAILQNVAVFKAFGNSTDNKNGFDGTQEMLALGMCNVISSFFQSMPVTGSLSRSAVNYASGVKTPLSGIYTGIIVLFALGTLTSTFYYIPKASLASVIIASLLFMIDLQSMIPMFKISKIEFLLMLVTFLASILIGIEYGIMIGLALSLLSLIYKSQMKINLEIEYKSISLSTNDQKTDDLVNSDDTNTNCDTITIENNINYIILSFKHNFLQFSSLDNFQQKINELLLQCSNRDSQKISFIVINFQGESFDKEGDPSAFDFTAIKSLVSLQKRLQKENGIKLIFLNCSKQRMKSFKLAGILDLSQCCCSKNNLEDFIQQLSNKYNNC